METKENENRSKLDMLLLSKKRVQFTFPRLHKNSFFFFFFFLYYSIFCLNWKFPCWIYVCGKNEDMYVNGWIIGNPFKVFKIIWSNCTSKQLGYFLASVQQTNDLIMFKRVGLCDTSQSLPIWLQERTMGLNWSPFRRV